jgi:hypothetical protein
MSKNLATAIQVSNDTAAQRCEVREVMHKVTRVGRLMPTTRCAQGGDVAVELDGWAGRWSGDVARKVQQWVWVLDELDALG